MKLAHIFPWIAVLCTTIYLEESSGLEKVNIGAIFSLDAANGKVAKIAMNAAVDDINSDPSVLGGYTLALQTLDSNNSGFLRIMGGKILINFFRSTYVYIIADLRILSSLLTA